MIARLETMVLMGMDLPVDAIRRQIAGGVDFFVHVGRRRDKSRKLLEIDEVCGMENGEVALSTVLSLSEEKGGVVWKKRNPVRYTEKFLSYS